MKIFKSVLNICLLAAAMMTTLSGCSDSGSSGPVNTGPVNSDDISPAVGPEAPADLEVIVSKMAAIGWANGASFSPKGDRIAYLSSATGSPQVWIHNSGTGQTIQATFFDDQVDDLAWSPAGDVLAVSVAPGGGLNSQLYLVSLAGAEPQMITAGGSVNNWLGLWSDDGTYLTFSSNSGGQSMDSYLYAVDSGEIRLIANNPGIGSVDAISPSAGRAVIWRMQSRGDTNLYLLDIDSGQEQLLTPHDGVATSDGARFLDENTLVLVTNIGREMRALGKIDIDDSGKAGPISILAGRDDAELDGFEVLAGGAELALLWNQAGQSQLAYFAVADQSMRTGPQLPAEIAGALTASSDGSQLAMTLSGASVPQNVWRLDPVSSRFSQVSSSAHDGVDLATLISPVLVRYPAHDGLGLSGWLYLPAQSSGPIPMVISFHGGPEGQSRPRFRSTFQALLSRGIGVFDANVRGSSGFGKTFVNLDNGALRVNGVQDIKATVDHLVAGGFASPGHIGIMGGSYGGYMVMAGLATFPELFAAGANLFGVVNFETFFANTEPWMAAISTLEYGNPVTEVELLRRLSPIHQVDQVVAPTIVLHGANDTNVPVVEAEQVVENLRARDVPVKYVLFPDEGHGWRKTSNRVTSDVEIVRWFERYL